MRIMYQCSLLKCFLFFVFASFALSGVPRAQDVQQAPTVPPASQQQAQQRALPFTELSKDDLENIFYRDYVDTRIQKLYALFTRIAIADTYLHVCDPEAKKYNRALYRLKADAVTRYFKQDVKRFNMVQYDFHTEILLDAAYTLIAAETQKYMQDTDCKGVRAKQASDFVKNLSELMYHEFDYYLTYIDKH